MIDIHTHILPGVDDGAATLKDSLAMARIAVADGVTHLFATPHHKDFKTLSRPETVERVAALQAELETQNIPLTLLPGYEVRLYDDVFADWDRNLAGPLGHSRYVLAEPLFNHYDEGTNDLLFELFERGYQPIMAHPERIIPLQHDLSLLEPFLEWGGLTQLTAGSLTTSRNSRGKETAETMLRRGMVHIIASDAHSPRYRQPILSQARQAAAKIVGAAQAEALVEAGPRAVVENKPFPTLPPAENGREYI